MKITTEMKSLILSDLDIKFIKQLDEIIHNISTTTNHSYEETLSVLMQELAACANSGYDSVELNLKDYYE